jgi:formylglycine-generating enzyme required for sulfatase activity
VRERVLAGLLVLASAGLVRADDRPARVAVPAGWFVRGSADGDLDERPVRKVWLDGFAIDRTEVTAAAYRGCVRRKRCAPRPSRGEDGGDRLPVTGVSWGEAVAYCRFAGGRLPTEAEWEKAARGPDGRRFPWGERVSCERANYGAWKGEGPCGAENPGRPIDVGKITSGASPYGALDLAGNVWEWVEDRYDPTAYARAGERNPRGPGRGTLRVARGGSCCSELLEPRVTNRVRWPEGYRDEDLGFRCAYAGH